MMTIRSQGDFATSVRRRLEDAGLARAELYSTEAESAGFGDTSVVFRIGPLLLRIVRDRGQEFVDMGTTDGCGRFFQYDDVEIAMGWRSVEEVLAKEEPEALSRVFERICGRLPELLTAFSVERSRQTEASVGQAERERGVRFIARLSKS